MSAGAQETRTLNLGAAARGRWRRFLEDSSLIREYLWTYRKLMAIGLIALIGVDLLEILPPIFLKQAVDVATGDKPLDLLWIVAASYLATAILQAICRYGWRMYLVRASILAGRDLRGKYAHHLFGLSASFFDRKPIGSLMSLATNDVEAVRAAIGMGFLVAADALFYFLSVPVAMLILSPKLTLLAFLPLPIIPWIVLRNEKEIHNRFEKVQESFSDISSLVQESLSGIRVVKAFAKEDAQMERIAAAGAEYVRRSMHLSRVQAAFGPTLDFTMSLGLVALLYVGGGGIVSGESAVTLGTFVAFQRYIQKMVWPMAAVGMAISFYQRSVTSSERLKDIFAQRTDVPEPDNAQAQPGYPRGAQPGPWKTAGAVEFRDLTFAFPATSQPVLRGINLSISPGERIAFIGAVGSGKSALLSLIPRIYPVGRGMLRIDGVDVNDWRLDQLRQQVGYVSQDVFLFSESVTENVAFGLHEWVERSGGGSIEEATRLAAIHEDVLGLEGSYKTRLGERGVNLSGGQKQRLTIARALAKQPPILVLDDALSSVDVQTEERILQGLRARPGRNTEIIAAHRISTIKDADRIVVLEGGAVHQMGTHQQLLAERSGVYRRFHEQQQLKEELEVYVNRLEALEESPS